MLILKRAVVEKWVVMSVKKSLKIDQLCNMSLFRSYQMDTSLILWKFSWPVVDHCIKSRVNSFRFKWWRLKHSATETLEVKSWKQSMTNNKLTTSPDYNNSMFKYMFTRWKRVFFCGNCTPLLFLDSLCTDNLYEKKFPFLTKFSLMFYNYVLINHISSF